MAFHALHTGVETKVPPFSTENLPFSDGVIASARTPTVGLTLPPARSGGSLAVV